MSVNSSSSSNASLPSSPSSINMPVMFKCLSSTVGAISVTTFSFIYMLLLFPLCSLVLYLGHQRWRQQRSSMTISHADLFTYHMVFAELLSVFGSTLICCGVHTDLPQMMILGIYLYSMNLCGQMYFHILTCVERYLAVVHPVTYLSLRKANGIRIRNITIGCVWLLCFASPALLSVAENVLLLILYGVVIPLILIVVSFCSLSVLCVLIRPRPGEGGGDRQQFDQAKLRAFYTIMAILGVLLVRFGGNLFGCSVFTTTLLGETEKCVIWLSMFWFSLPSSLVLPLLFLQRAGKLLCCKNNSESGQGSD